MKVAGFSNPASVVIYDVTDIGQVKVIDNAGFSTLDGGLTYQASFLAASGADGTLG